MRFMLMHKTNAANEARIRPSLKLIAGFLTLEVPSMAEAMDWAPRYAAVLGDVEMDARPLFEPHQLQ